MPASRTKIALSASRDIPFNKLVLSQANVRRVQAGISIEELAEDIARRTLLTALTVRPVLDENGAETGIFEVPAGGRRFKALERLVAQKRLNKTAPIPCIVRTEGIAEEDSLAENVQRVPLHPLDQFRAFETLREKGQTVDEIAAAFFVTPNVVKQRLKLAAVAPALLEAYANEEMVLDQLMAFTVSPDHERQIEVWEGLKQRYGKQPHEIRRLLTEGAVRNSDRRAKFVGIETYEGAGGVVLRDLFQPDDGGWLQDAGLLERMVADKLTAEAEAVRAEGWRWVQVEMEFPYGYTYGMRRIVGEPEPISEADQSQLDELRSEHAELEAEYAEADELPDAIDTRLGELETAIEAIEQRPLRFTAEDLAIAGAFVSIDAAGRLRIDRGFIRPEDEPVVEPELKPQPDDGADNARSSSTVTEGDDSKHPTVSIEPDPDEIDDPSAPFSDRLLTSLSAHRTMALADALANDPPMAFLAALHALTLRLFYRSGRESCVEIEPRRLSLGSHIPALADAPYAQAIEERNWRWAETLPSTSAELWQALVSLDGDSREALFAHCISLTLNAVNEPYAYRSRAIAHADQLGMSLDLDMAKAGWKPTADTYFAHVTKAQILDAVRDAKDEATADRLAGLKKPQMIAAAEDLLADSGWLPAALRTARPDGGTERSGDGVGRDGATSSVDDHDVEAASGRDTDPAEFATAAE
ncbi:MAG: ParB N-terminal domain-containing protein [Pseudomonadota bacterium]